jgi:tetratricopeptide (TPR) repeat protein
MHNAVLMRKLENYEKALKYVNLVLELDADSVKHLNFKAEILEKLQRYEEALNCYHEALAINPNDKTAIINLEQIKKSFPRLVDYIELKTFIDKYSKIYDLISFDKIHKETKIDRTALESLLEELLFKNEIQGKINQEILVFTDKKLKKNGFYNDQSSLDKQIEVLRGGDWKIEGDQSVFYYKVKVKNKSQFMINNIQVLLTSTPTSLKTHKILRNFSNLAPNSFFSPTFKFIATKDCVGDKIEGYISYKDHLGGAKTIQIKPYEIKYVCNLLVPKKIRDNEYEKNTFVMNDFRNSFICEGNIHQTNEYVMKILRKNNFYVLPKDKIDKNTDFIKIRGYAEGKYDHTDIAMEIALQRLENNTQLILKSMSDKMEKLYDINKDISVQCFEIKTDTELIKEYLPLIENIFQDIGKLEEIELYLKEHLASDWEKIKNVWEEYKSKKITLRQFLKTLVKSLGKKTFKILSKGLNIIF